MFPPKPFPGYDRPKSGKYSFSEDERTEIFNFAINEIRKYSDCLIALCKESVNVWNRVGLSLEKYCCACRLEAVDMSTKIS